jgi:WD40 repeat protein
VIEDPAVAKVVYFEASETRGYLVDQLIDEVAGMPGALPLLSFTLSELYLKLAGRYLTAQTAGETIERAITWRDYDELSGVTKSLTQRAEQIYDALVTQDPTYEQTICHVMLRMVAVGGELARRQVLEAELTYPEPENHRVQRVIQDFLKARLLVSGLNRQNQPYMEPAHDALVRGWPRLLTWRQEGEERLLLQRRLTPAVMEWEQITKHYQPNFGDRTGQLFDGLDRVLLPVEWVIYKIINLPADMIQNPQKSVPHNSSIQEKPQQFLWNSNPYLDVLKQTLNAPNTWLNQPERQFVQASILQKRRNISWRWRTVIAVMLGLSGLTLAALIGQRNALINQSRASQQSAEANFTAGRQLEGYLDSLRSAQSLQHPLLRLSPPAQDLKTQIQGTLQKAVFATQERNRLGNTLGIVRSAVSPDGQQIASIAGDGTLTLWDWQGRAVGQWNTQQGSVMNLTYSPDGKTIATAGGNGTITLWNLQGQPLTQLKGHTDMVKGLSFSPDSRLLVSSGRDRTVRLWSVEGKPLAVMNGHQKDVWSVDFSPDGTLIASAADDDTLRLWNLQGEQVRMAKAQQGQLHTVRFSPDGQSLVTAGQDGSLRLWDWQCNPKATFLGHQGRVWQVTFSDDGQRLASASADGTVRLWSLSGQVLAILTGHEGPARNVGFNANNQHLFSSGDDGFIHLWDLQGQQITKLTGHQGAIRAIAWSPDGQQLASAGQDGNLNLWQLPDQRLKTFNGNQGPVRAIAFSPDGQQIAMAQGNTVRLWTLVNQQFAEFKTDGGLVRSLQFSPDGQWLVTGSEGGAIHLWDHEGKSLATWAGDGQRIWDVRFSPDGQTLASVGQEGVVKQWSLKGQLLGKFAGHLGPVYSVAFSPNGEQIASAGQDGTIRLWDGQHNRKIGLFQVYEAEVNSITFSPDGKFLLSGDNQGNVQLWDWQAQQQFAAWGAHPNRILRQASFSPDGKQLATAGDDGVVKIWQPEAFESLLPKACGLISNYLYPSTLLEHYPTTPQLDSPCHLTNPHLPRLTEEG